MKDQALQFFANSSSQILTLISVLVGGFMTYLSTSSIERYKVRKQDQKANLENILIPYCTRIEETIEIVEGLYQYEIYDLEKISLDVKLDMLNAPLVYLHATKRIYLSESSRKLLTHYKDLLSAFLSKLSEESELCLNKYKSSISAFFQEFDYNDGSCYDSSLPAIEISVHMKNSSSEMLKFAIIKRSEITLIDEINSVKFVFCDDPANYISKVYDLSEEVRNEYDAVCREAKDFDQLELKDQEVCDLLKYIAENLSSDKEVLSEKIEKAQSSMLLNSVHKNLEVMKKELLKEIDKVTG
ncbi:hypothetical protein [Acetobacterium bakii]|uniref:Uncharacterized protein n=1 Tax=Acetobacterium bakii TaxID=52689 RepID=A0A0L6TZ91_9FIRM|nr:hypothetical protein [Acetobacterium bakii]KNZ41382.1 hypothetical protein AKG39_12230 [Acetobacterium bakii]